MATLRPPSTSPSPSPAPGSHGLSQQNGRNPSARASMGPTRLGGVNVTPSSPRPVGITGVGRPTSELLGSGGMFQTPESEAIDQWFENLQNYEATLEEMAAASLDVNFKEELSAIEQWFRVLSEAERTAALYSLLQHSTQVQIRFFITVLQQMARSDPMTALLSPSVGGGMQAQMEAKLNSMGLKSPGISSPSGRNFGPTQRQSLAVESSNYLSPDAANMIGPNGPSGNSDAANTLAQQRAKLKANAAHRISAPGTLAGVTDGNLWAQGASKLGQLVESSASPSNDDSDLAPANTNIRPKSTDFSGAIRQNVRSSTQDSDEPLSPMGQGGSWASMVNTPAVPMFNHQETNGQTIDTVASRLNSWSMSNASGGKMQLDDAKKYRRISKNAGDGASTTSGNGGNNTQGVYDENGNLVQNNGQPGQARGGVRSVSAGGAGGGQYLGAAQQQQQGQQGQWGGLGGARSPSGFSNASSNRFASDDGMAQFANMAQFAGLGNGVGVGSPGMAALGMGGFGGMAGLNMNMLQAMGGMNGLAGLGMNDVNSLQTQLLAAQLAASGSPMFNPALNPALFGLNSAGRSSARSNGRSPASGKTSSLSGRGGTDSSKEKEEEVDPKLLEDVPAWLRSLRLHKYTPNFQNSNWKDMVLMDEAALEAKGVAALGARRKMLKTFELVRAKMGIDMANPPAIPP